MSNEELFETIKKQLADYEKRISKLEALSETKPEPIAKKFSIKEFLLSKKPKDYPSKTLAIAYYLEKYEKLPSFNAKDVEKGFRLAREPLPKNINDNVNKNISKGYIMEAPEKKDNLTAWVLTSSGEIYVESSFEKKK